MSCDDIEKTLCCACLDEVLDHMKKIKPSPGSMIQDAPKSRLKRTLLAFLFDACHVDEMHNESMGCISEWIDEWIDGHFSPS